MLIKLGLLPVIFGPATQPKKLFLLATRVRERSWPIAIGTNEKSREKNV